VTSSSVPEGVPFTRSELASPGETPLTIFETSIASSRSRRVLDEEVGSGAIFNMKEVGDKQASKSWQRDQF
jgi:hypothetical protein